MVALRVLAGGDARQNGTSRQVGAVHQHGVAVCLAIDQVQGAQPTYLVVGQLHGGEGGNEQLPRADHVVVTQHGHVLGDPQTPRQQHLIDHERAEERD